MNKPEGPIIKSQPSSAWLQAVLKGRERVAIRLPGDNHGQSSYTNWYFLIGRVLAVLSGAATFLAAWYYCVTSYGLLLGIGLGWLPSGTLAFIVSSVVWLIWAPILLVLALLFFGVI